MTSQQSSDPVNDWLRRAPASLRFVCVALAATAVLAAMLTKLGNNRDIPPWERNANRDGLWRVVERANGSVEVGRGMLRDQDGDLSETFNLAFTAKVTGVAKGDEPGPYTIWLERTVRVERLARSRKDRLDPAVEKRLLGHIAARFPDPELSSLVAAGGGSIDRWYWSWLGISLWVGLGFAAVVELMIWIVRLRRGHIREPDGLMESES